MDAPLALYRRYRPETFAEVIGQDHVTEPLRHALAANRTHHAYLFSGPRGCGKTTSARILARALNCEQAPIADPCGECQSCQDLARGGPGSIDVIEIDAATHGNVDDTRDLRERAFFAPVNSRYKVYIVDEAHMVSPAGFNALLKLVEEPPPHLKFIFATTEPDKVIGTIRSRTHHYPFRLVPPATLTDYLGQLAQSEQVTVEPSALPLVVRAGGGSVRDSLSVFDQLLGGAGEQGLTYDLATRLLGYTPDALLDEVVDAMAAGDGASVFSVVDKVIESGQDPRRFTEDVLQRLRDLIVLSVIPDAGAQGLVDVPAERVEHLKAQATGFGPAELTRTADIVNTALVDFRGATAPRMLLELMCARILVPGADDSVGGLQARLDRIEKRLSMDGGAPRPASTPTAEPAVTSAASTPVTEPEPAPEPEQEPEPDPTPASPVSEAADPEPEAPSVAEPEPAVDATPVAEPEADTAEPDTAPAEQVQPEPEPAPEPEPETTPEEAPAAVGSMSAGDVRRLWPEILDKVQSMRRFAWVILSQNSQVVGVEGTLVTIGLPNAGARDSFAKNKVEEPLSQALAQVLGGTWQVETVIDASTTGPDSTPPPAAAAPAEPARQAASPEAVQEVRDRLNEKPEDRDIDADASIDDPVIDDGTGDPIDLLSRELGAEVIDETTHD